MGVARVARRFPLLVLALSAELSSAASEKAVSRALLAASAKEGLGSHEGAGSSLAARLELFLEQVRSLRGRRTGARIGHLARGLESRECSYEKDLEDTDVAVVHFVNCIHQIEGTARKTLDVAEIRGKLNAEYGDNAEASLMHARDTVRDLNHLHRRIVTEHKVATDWLAKEVLSIKGQVNQISEDNKEHQRQKGWLKSEKDEDDELEGDANGDLGFRPSVEKEDPHLAAWGLTVEEVAALKSKKRKEPNELVQTSSSSTDGPLIVQADRDEDGQSLAQLKQELRRVRTKMAAYQRRHPRAVREKEP